MAGEPLDITPAPPGPTPISATTQDQPSLEEAVVRAAVMRAEGIEETVAAPAAQTPPTAPEAPPAQSSSDVPKKFLNNDGTVDVEKLQASTRQLDAGTQEKTLSIDEMVAQYREKERQFRALPRQQHVVAQVAEQAVQAAPVPQAVPQDQTAILQQIQQDYQRDPVGTIIDIVKVMTEQQLKPAKTFMEQVQEQQRDAAIRENLADLARADPRVANPAIYGEIVKQLDSDPGYLKLKNPHKTAWNDVKARLRLGDTQAPAQPSRPSAPILGGGIPPPVPSTSGASSPENVAIAIKQMSNPKELAAVESELRRLFAGSQW